ncbi:MAG: response regulator [Clostridia bacterium]|nr:response regulator [Clostridia bacterium]
MMKLLLVDDESMILDGIVGMVDWKRMGISVSAACESALMALECMKDDMPDILLADVKMPGMSGLELVEHARTLYPGLQCIILSAYDDFDFARRAMRAGVLEYLLKPCSQDEIEAALVRACNMVRLEQERLETRSTQRRERIMQLVERLKRIKPDHRGNIEAAQVREVCAGLTDETLLQEAMIYLVAHSVEGAAQAEWSLRTVKDLYTPEAELYRYSAQALTQMFGHTETRHSFVYQMQSFINEHFSMENLSLQYMADHLVYMSADYIGREFTHVTGMKFSAYLLSVRMEHAKHLITTHPDMHTYEIAEQVGLGHNPRYFSQLFRKYTGMTPSDFGRKTDKNTNF